MPTRSRRDLWLGLTATLILGFASCNKSSTSPSPALDRAQQVDVTTHGAAASGLMPNGPRDRNDHTGIYTLTLTTTLCTPTFPEAGKRRVYTAHVVQKGADVRVTLSGADFEGDANAFAGTVTPTGEIRFIIRPEWWWDYDWFDVVERVDGIVLIVQGGITVRSTPAGIVGNHDPDPNAANALGIRRNDAYKSGEWCTIDRFEMVPRRERVTPSAPVAP